MSEATLLQDVFQMFIDAIAEAVSQRMMKGRERMISQTHSELGPRRHRAAVKRRLANGEGGAGIDGRKYLLTPEALHEELTRSGRGSDPPPSNDPCPGGRPPAGGSNPVQKSRARVLGDFERELMTGLRAVK